MNMEFYDIYWEEDDLTENEKSRFLKDSETLFQQYLDKLEFIDTNQLYKCPLCNESSQINSFEGNINMATCPKCKATFKPPAIGDLLISALYRKNL